MRANAELMRALGNALDMESPERTIATIRVLRISEAFDKRTIDEATAVSLLGRMMEITIDDFNAVIPPARMEVG